MLLLLNQESALLDVDDDEIAIAIGIKVCMPTKFEYDNDGRTVNYEVESDEDALHCKGVGLLVFATIASLCISATACLVYVYKDFRSLPGKGTLNLMLILLQSGLVMAALLREVDFWQKSYGTAFELYDGASVRVHGSRNLLAATCGFSLLTCLILMIRKALSIFSPAGKATKVTNSEVGEAPESEESESLDEAVIPYPEEETNQQTVSPAWASTEHRERA